MLTHNSAYIEYASISQYDIYRSFCQKGCFLRERSRLILSALKSGALSWHASVLSWLAPVLARLGGANLATLS